VPGDGEGLSEGGDVDYFSRRAGKSKGEKEKRGRGRTGNLVRYDVDISLVDVDIGSETAWSVVAVEADLGVAERTTAGFARLALATGDDRFTMEKKEVSKVMWSGAKARKNRKRTSRGGKGRWKDRKTHTQTFVPFLNFTASTPSPTSSMTPENSCPSVAGTVVLVSG
jgi:hypothetical protein